MDRSRYSVRAAERVLRILKNFNLEQPERGYATVAEETNIPQTTVFKLMNVMAEEGFLEETGRKGRYRIGLEAYRVGNLYLVDKRLIEVAGPWLQRLAERLGMTANLGVRSGDVALRVLSEQGTSRLSLTVQLGESMPLSASGLGKALVLDMEEVELAQLLPPSPWHQLTANSFVDIPQLWADLRLSEERGYTLDDEEGTVGIRCLGFPIRNRAGEIIAAISVTGTTIEITDESLPGIIRAVKTFGLNISTELGYHSS